MEQKRFVGIDLGKRTYEIKFIASNGSVTGTNGKTCPSGRKELYKKRNYSAPKIPGIMQEFQQRQVLQLQRRLFHVFLLSRYKNGF